MLFKYVTPERFDILVNQTVRLTQPSEFNDPFELHPTVDLMSKADIAALPDAPGGGKFLTTDAFHNMVAAALPVIQKNSALHAVNPGAAFSISNDDILRTYYDATFGILCLSRVHDSLLMWAHYSDHHRGFVMGFDEAHPIFQGGDVVLGLPRLAPVTYNDRRPVLSLSTKNTPEVFFRKSTQWSYEHEVRMIRRLDESKFTLDRGSALPVHLFEMPHEAIVKVITGARMRETDYRALCEYCTATPTLNHVEIHHMQLSRDHYKLVTMPPLDEADAERARSGDVLSARDFEV